ncbi:MAG: peptidoglycan DD-metalloendopeptidase family protein [Oscillospiraceae bacterium]
MDENKHKDNVNKDNVNKSESKNNLLKSVYFFLKEISYIVGIAVVEFLLVLLEKFEIAFAVLCNLFKMFVVTKFVFVFKFTQKHFNVVITDFKYFLKKVSDMKRILYEKFNNTKNEKGLKAALEELKLVFKNGIYKNKFFVRKVINIALPTICALIFAFSSYTIINLNYVLSVNYNGKDVGVIQSEKSYDVAKSKMLDQLVLEDKNEIATQKSNFTITVAGKTKVKEDRQLTRDLISASGEKIEEAYGVYINGDVIIAGKDKDVIEGYLESKRQPYIDSNQGSIVSYVSDIQIVEGLYPVNLVSEDNIILEKLNSDVKEKRLYKVKSGDYPEMISQKNNITLGELRNLNPNLIDLMVVGREVVISANKPLLQVQIVRQEVYQQEIGYTIEEIKNSQYNTGYKKVTQDGKNGVSQITAQVTYIDGIEQSRQTVNSQIITKPINQEITVGTSQIRGSGSSNTISYNGGPVGSGKLLWPTSGGRVSNGYLGYYNHKAIDISNNYGAAIYAADDGVVVTSGWSRSGYGYYVVVNHGNGMQTLYAHNSRNAVSPGQVVKKGQTIAYVGSTGNSSGNHLHFEVIVNGSKRNPMIYL